MERTTLGILVATFVCPRRYRIDGTLQLRNVAISCHTPLCFPVFFLFFFHLFYHHVNCCPAQLVRGFDPQRPPSGRIVAAGVFLPPPPVLAFSPSFLSHVGFSIPTFQLFMVVDLRRISPKISWYTYLGRARFLIGWFFRFVHEVCDRRR